MKISIIIPVFNEANTLKEVIGHVKFAPFGYTADREIIVVDDASTDDSASILASIENIKLTRLPKNQGKGAALKRGFQMASGDIVLIQDADLEYDTKDYPRLLKPVFDGRADVVFGNRFHGEVHSVIYFRNFVGNKFLTLVSNLFTGLNLGDMEVGYKVFRKEVLDSFKDKLVSKRFGIEPELVARVSHGSWKVVEVPVNYYGRTYEAGKKIGIWDGIKALGAIVYFSVSRK
jgi:glycosyltransferase involved in cell wall biosynthesis